MRRERLRDGDNGKGRGAAACRSRRSGHGRDSGTHPVFAVVGEARTAMHIPCIATETTMPRTPHDNSAEMKATAERRKALVAQRKTRLGELLQSTGADGILDFDQIAGLIRDGLERLDHNPGLKATGVTQLRNEEPCPSP